MSSRRRGSQPPSPIAEEAHRLACTRGIDPKRGLACLERLVETLAPKPVNDPTALTDAPTQFPLSLLDDAITSFGGEQAVRLIEQQDLVAMARRVAVVEYLAQQDTPLLTLQELASCTRSFIASLHEHRKYLLDFGLLPQSFRPCRWLYLHLGRLYDVKATGSPCPADEICSGSDELPPYRWIRWTRNENRKAGHKRRRASDVVFRSSAFTACEYGDADLLDGMQEEDASRIEKERRRIFKVKLGLLDLLASAAEPRDASQLWSDCLAVLTKEFNAEEVDFYLRMDRFYLETNAPDGLGAGVEPRRSPGGLTNLLEVVGHFEQEIKCGVLDWARTALDRSLLDALRTPPERDNLHRWRYFALFDRAARAVLDEVIDGAASRTTAAEAFWNEYRNRVSDAMREEFRVLVPIELHPRYLSLIRPVLQQHADCLQAQCARGESITQKRSTEQGEARTKIIGMFSTHHQYYNGACVNFCP